jgi:hypothetical protein
MSRSHKKHSAAKICGRSDKKDKRFANRRFRKMTRQLLRELETERLPQSMREVSNAYTFSSDGLAMWMPCPGPDHPNKYWNKEAWEKMMRK